MASSRTAVTARFFGVGSRADGHERRGQLIVDRRQPPAQLARFDSRRMWANAAACSICADGYAPHARRCGFACVCIVMRWRLQAQQRGNGVLRLREYENPVCVRSRPRQTRNSTSFLAPRGDDVERLARMRRGGAALRQSRCAARTIGGVTQCGAPRLGRRRSTGGGAWRPTHAVVSLPLARGGERLGRGAGRRYVAVAGVVARPSWTN